jgi:hypothetical protein
MVEKKTFSSVVETLTISLWMNATGNVTFDFTVINQPYLFVKTPLKWNATTRLLNEKSTNETHQLLFLKSSTFQYQLNMIPMIDSPFIAPVECDYLGDMPLCAFNHSTMLRINTLPSNLNFSLQVTHKISRKTMELGVDYKTYYRNMNLVHLKPFIISYYERLNKPVRIISNVGNNLNLNFNFSCNCIIFIFNYSHHSKSTKSIQVFYY